MADLPSFTPAAGRFAPTSLYDAGVALLTREATWRNELIGRLAPAKGRSILDVGCGTGSLAIALKRAAPQAHIVGLDPDPVALNIARRKAAAAGVEIEWHNGFASEAARFGKFDQVVSSLVFHQVSLDGKRSGIAAMFDAAKPDGHIFIADYATQPRWAMRQLFRFIQLIDGHENTQLNADGFIEAELGRIVGKCIAPVFAVATPTGTISIFCERKPIGNKQQGVTA